MFKRVFSPLIFFESLIMSGYPQGGEAGQYYATPPPPQGGYYPPPGQPQGGQQYYQPA